ncbi:MAG: hypothetical protein ACI9R3_005165 [Verrucomicrobiales bacterium]
MLTSLEYNWQSRQFTVIVILCHLLSEPLLLVSVPISISEISIIKTSIIILLFLAGLAGGTSSADEITPEVDSALQRGLAIVTGAASRWQQNKTCFTCHHQTLPMLAVTEAGKAGLALDQTWLDAQAATPIFREADRYDARWGACPRRLDHHRLWNVGPDEPDHSPLLEQRHLPTGEATRPMLPWFRMRETRGGRLEHG